jgi:hypothetical protein
MAPHLAEHRRIGAIDPIHAVQKVPNVPLR